MESLSDIGPVGPLPVKKDLVSRKIPERDLWDWGDRSVA